MSFKRLSALFIALAISVAPVAAAEPPTPTISLSAEGRVSAVPDTAIINAGVLTEKETAAEALTENNAAMRRTLEVLKAAGIADKDIGTSGFSIDPVMVYPDNYDSQQQPPKIVGYRVNNQLTVKIREISKAGTVLDELVRVGTNNIQGVSFVVENDAKLRDEARAAAIKAVRARAEVYAAAGGFAVGEILSVSEMTDSYPRADVMPAPMMEAKAGDSVPLALGQRDIAVTVSATFAIRPR